MVEVPSGNALARALLPPFPFFGSAVALTPRVTVQGPGLAAGQPAVAPLSLKPPLLSTLTLPPPGSVSAARRDGAAGGGEAGALAAGASHSRRRSRLAT